MSKRVLLVLVFMLLGQSLAPAAQAAGPAERLLPGSNAPAKVATISDPSESTQSRPRDDFWARLWTLIVSRVRALSAAIIRWIAVTLKQGLGIVWERIRREAGRLWSWLQDLWAWMNLRGDVGPIR